MCSFLNQSPAREAEPPLTNQATLEGISHIPLEAPWLRGEGRDLNKTKKRDGKATEQMVMVSSAIGYVFIIILNNNALVIIMLSLSMLSLCLLAHDMIDLLDRLWHQIWPVSCELKCVCVCPLGQSVLLSALVSPGSSFLLPPEPGVVQTMAVPSTLSWSEDSAEEQSLQGPAKGKWQDKEKKTHTQFNTWRESVSQAKAWCVSTIHYIIAYVYWVFPAFQACDNTVSLTSKNRKNQGWWDLWSTQAPKMSSLLGICTNWHLSKDVSLCGLPVYPTEKCAVENEWTPVPVNRSLQKDQEPSGVYPGPMNTGASVRGERGK